MVIRWLLIAALILTVAGATASDMGSKLSVNAGYMHLTDGEVRAIAGNGLGLNIGYTISSNESRDIGASIGYFGFSNTVSEMGFDFDVDTSVVPVMATMHLWPNGGSSLYYGFGLGLVHLNIKISERDYGVAESESETDLGYELFVGRTFSERGFAELKYLSGRRPGNTGVVMSVGARF